MFATPKGVALEEVPLTAIRTGFTEYLMKYIRDILADIPDPFDERATISEVVEDEKRNYPNNNYFAPIRG